LTDGPFPKKQMGEEEEAVKQKAWLKKFNSPSNAPNVAARRSKKSWLM